MERKHFWIYLAIGLAFGCGMEWMKRSAPDVIRIVKLEEPDTDPNQRPKHRWLSKPWTRLKIPTDAIVAGLTPAIPAPAAAPTAAAKDTKKPKKDDKKKKDEKKKDEKPQAGAPLLPPSSDDTKEKKKAPTTAADAAPDAGAAYGNPPNPNSLPQTLEEWEAYILAQADMSRTQLLVKQYKAGMVVSQVFYPVVQAMLADGRQDMRHLGLFALNETPSEPSFALLVVFLDNHPSSHDRAEAQNLLQSYGTVSRLPILAAALQATGDADVNFQAMALLKSSADHTIPNLTATAAPTQVPGRVPTITATTAATGPTNPAVGVMSEQQKSSVARSYSSIASLLLSLAHTYPSASLRQAAVQTATHLQTALATAGYSAS